MIQNKKIHNRRIRNRKIHNKKLQNRKIQTTRKYLRRKFVRVILATFVFVFLPIFLIVFINHFFSNSDLWDQGAEKWLCESREDIDVSDFLKAGGRVAIVDENLQVTNLGEKNIFDKTQLSREEWTSFLCKTGQTYGWITDVAYQNGDEPYWLVMMQPRAVTIDIHFGKNSESPDYRFTLITVLLIFSTYFVALLLFVKVYSKRAARRVTDSLENVSNVAKTLESGEYDVTFEKGETAELDDLGKAMIHLAGELKAKEEIKKEEEEKRMLLVSELSHDLKTPLASVQGYSEMLMNGVADEEKKQDYLKMIYDNSIRANGILQALFTYSKLGSAGYRPTVENVDLCEFTRQIMAEYIPQFENVGFLYQLSIPEEEIPVKMNRELFRRVYDNLFENSMKYNRLGQNDRSNVTVGVNIIREDHRVKIEIYDDGVGIPKEHADKIFTPFYRVDGEVRSKESGGSGLGLAIVKRIVELHGGEIEYVSNDEKTGCRYIITI